jgi:predicted lipoprotein
MSNKRKNVFKKKNDKKSRLTENIEEIGLSEFIDNNSDFFNNYENNYNLIETLNKLANKIDILSNKISTIENILDKDNDKNIKIDDLTDQLNMVKLNNDELKYMINNKNRDIDYYA